ncbi:MAG: endonuclease [Alphaproteobacteria bacterium]|nr:MAG: endonuclease [Alphaproteobacteria bacterium]
MIRIATFNLENLDEDKPGQRGPSFAERAAVLRPMLARLRADLICFQEINGQEREGQPRDILTLKELLAGTRYQNHTLVSTRTTTGQVYDERNLVTAIRPDITVEEVRQIRHDIVPRPVYRTVTGGDGVPDELTWERPLLYTRLADAAGRKLHVLNVHFKSKLASNVPGQKADSYTWRSAAGWAEGFILSSIKRVGAALEARVLIDRIFDADADANIVVAGDFNAKSDEVPVMAIRGRVEDTGNGTLAGRVMVPLEDNVPETSRFSLIHQGRGEMIDHILVSRRMLAAFRHTEIHNEILPDESVAFATDLKFPESDHAPVVAEFDVDLMPAHA